jgi:hypothetical protein
MYDPILCQDSVRVLMGFTLFRIERQELLQMYKNSDSYCALQFVFAYLNLDNCQNNSE